MRILQINASYKPAYIYGGPTMSVSKLSEQLIQTGCEVEVFTTTANGDEELPVHAKRPVMVSGVPVYYFGRITKDHSHFSPALLKAVWQKAKSFDVVHVHTWWNMVSMLSVLIALMRGLPILVSPRGTLSGYSFVNKNSLIKRFIHHLMTRPLLKRCSIHATSPYEAEGLRQIIKPKQIIVIPNFIRFPVPPPVKTTRFAGQLQLLFFSRIEEKKGLDILLNALSDIRIPHHLTIAGTGDGSYIAALKQLAIKNNVEENITWLGFQKENKFDLLASHHLLVLPSYDENFGNVIIESLSVGTAVLVSKQVGLAGYIAENNLGWICETNASSVAATINQIGYDSLARISESAAQVIRRDFDELALTETYTSMYQQVIKNG